METRSLRAVFPLRPTWSRTLTALGKFSYWAGTRVPRVVHRTLTTPCC